MTNFATLVTVAVPFPGSLGFASCAALALNAVAAFAAVAAAAVGSVERRAPDAAPLLFVAFVVAAVWPA